MGIRAVREFTDQCVGIDGEPGEQPVLSGGVRVPLASATPWPAVDGALQVDLRSFGVDNVGAIPMPNISKNGAKPARLLKKTLLAALSPSTTTSDQILTEPD